MVYRSPLMGGVGHQRGRLLALPGVAVLLAAAAGLAVNSGVGGCGHDQAQIARYEAQADDPSLSDGTSA